MLSPTHGYRWWRITLNKVRDCNDGKSWLLKVTKKTKTIFWLSIFRNSSKITFYFGDKAEPAIMAGDISEGLKTQFENGKRYRKIRGITITIDSKSAVNDALALMEIKLKIK